VRTVQRLGAKPKVHVAYRREAYVPHDDNSARLTLDREIRSERQTALRFSTKLDNPIYIWGNAVVVELKFTNRFPEWFGELVRVFHLRQCGAAKYADGVALLEGATPKHKNMPPAALISPQATGEHAAGPRNTAPAAPLGQLSASH
jgi:hypothetical protein